MKKLLPLFLLLSLLSGAFAQLQPNAWPKAHSDLGNSSLSPAWGAFDLVKWNFNLGVAKNFIRSPSVDKNNIVYLASTDGNTYALHGDTGKVKWSSPIGSTSYSSPAIDLSGTVYVGIDQGFLFALDGDTGGVLWKIQPSSQAAMAVGPPTIGTNGTIYVECNDGYLYAINPAIAAVTWKYNIGSDANDDQAAMNTPAIGSDGTIYVGGGQEMTALKPDGTSVWTFLSGSGSTVTSPAIGVNGNLYFGSSTGAAFAITSAGKLLWTYMTQANILATPGIGPNDMVYVGSMDENMYALDPLSGTLQWSYKGTGGVYATPVIAGDGTVYMPTFSANMFALNGDTGDLEWSFATKELCYDPAIGPDGSLYLPSGDGSLYAFAAGVVPTTLQLDPSSVVGGYPSVGTVYLNKPATSLGITLTLSSDTEGIGLPSSVYIPAGQQSVSFNITTPVVVQQFNATISATAGGTSVSAVLTLAPLQITSLTLNPTSLAGGATVTGTVTLNGISPPIGVTVSLYGNNTAITVPGLVNIAPGQTTATFQIKTVPVTQIQYAVVTAQLNGASTQLAYLTVNPSQLSTLIFTPSTVGGGSSATGTVTLTGPAPTGGFQVLLSNSSSSASLPKSITIPAGQSSGTFSVHTTQVTKQTVAVVVASLAALTRAASLTIVPPQIESISLSPTTVAGGTSVKGTVYLTGDANKSGLSVKLKSSVKGVTVPAAVAVGSGKSSATFTVTTIAVSSLTKATITGTTGTVSATATLTVNQPTLVSLTVSPTSVKGGKTSTGTVKISSVAPTGGMVIELTSAANGVTVPAKVTVPAGRTSVTFTVKTVKGMPTGAVSISATQGASSKSATITLT